MVHLKSTKHRVCVRVHRVNGNRGIYFDDYRHTPDCSDLKYRVVTLRVITTRHFCDD